MEQYELPDGWRWVELRDIVGSMKNGLYKPRDCYGSGTPCLRMYNLSKGEILWKDIKLLRLSLKEIDEYGLLPGDILINRVNSRELIGKAAVIPPGLGPLVFESKNIRLRIRTDWSVPRYVTYFLQTPAARDQIDSGAKQTVGMATINQADINAWTIPLPPLPEQQRIVARIESLFEQSRAAREALDRIPALIKRFRQSVLAAAFRGDLTERDPDDEPASTLLARIGGRRGDVANASSLPELPVGWVWTTIGDVFTVALGGTPARKEKRFWDGDIPWVSSGEVAFSRIKTTREQITRDGLAHSNATLHPVGTVLLAMIGEGKTRGQAAILDVSATTNQNVASIICSETPVPSEWVFWWLMAHYQDTRGGGSGGAQPALNAARVRGIPLPLAPLPEQRRIVVRIQALFAQADAVEAAVAVARRRLAALDQAVLARGFRGEL